MIAIVQYNAGNIASVGHALRRLGAEYLVTDKPSELLLADKVIFPGVGEASSAMKYLKARKLDLLIPTLRQPVLGICLGLQLMCLHSEEGDTDCLGIFDAAVTKFPPKDRVPHMGWNNLQKLQSPLLEGVNEQHDFYFVHSYFAETSGSTIALCDYIHPFSAAMQKDNFYAVQFHPEKSASAGERVLSNFLKL